MKTDERKWIKDIAARLKQARINAGYTKAKDFIEAFGLSGSAYYHHENGTRSIHIDVLRKYAELLKVHQAWLLTGEELYSAVNDIEQTEHLSDDDFLELSKIDSEAGEKKRSLTPRKIDVDLLGQIAEEVYILLNTAVSQTSMKDVIKIAVGIYEEITGLTSDREMQKKMIRTSIRGVSHGLKIEKKAQSSV